MNEDHKPGDHEGVKTNTHKTEERLRSGILGTGTLLCLPKE